MTPDETRPRARPIPVPIEEPLLGGARYDYADAFQIRAAEPDARSAEEFARAALKNAPPLVRWTVVVVQRYLLGLRLGPWSSPNRLLGWRIVTSERDVVHIEAESSLLRGVVIARRVEPTLVVLSTYVFYKRPAAARVVWKVVGPLHRWVAPYLLERAAKTTATLQLA